MSRSRVSGFTLVEVMVALAVVAIALPALMFTLYQQTDGIEYLRDRSQAQMIAANTLSEVRLSSRARSSLFQGSESGVTEFAGRDWFWKVKSETTEVPQFYRIEISVGLGDDPEAQPLQSLVAFLSADLARDLNPSPEDTGDPGEAGENSDTDQQDDSGSGGAELEGNASDA